MDGEAGGLCGGDNVNEASEVIVAIVRVNAQAMLYGNWFVGNAFDSRYDLCNTLGCLHELGTEHAFLYLGAGASNIQIVFIVSILLCYFDGAGTERTVAAANLQRDGVFAWMECKQGVGVAVHNCSGGDHLSVQKRTGREDAGKVAEVAVGTIHHWGDANGVTGDGGRAGGSGRSSMWECSSRRIGHGSRDGSRRRDGR